MGACTTVSLVVVCLCLRFRTDDVQRMVNLLRRWLRKNGLFRNAPLLKRIRAWQESLMDTDVHALRHALGLTHRDGETCGAVLDTGACPLPARQPTVWCEQHAPPPPAPAVPVATFRTYQLPGPFCIGQPLAAMALRACAHFDRDAVWECVAATALGQARCGPDDRSPGLVVVRFSGFAQKHDTLTDVWPTVHRVLQSLRNCTELLLVQLLNAHRVRDSFLAHIQTYIQPNEWPRLLVYHEEVLLYASVNVDVPSYRTEVVQLAQTARNGIRIALPTIPSLRWFEQFLEENTASVGARKVEFAIDEGLHRTAPTIVQSFLETVEKSKQRRVRT